MLLPLATLFAFSAFLRAQGQQTNATCFEEYDWMRNSKSQSPCLIAAWLGFACKPPNPIYNVGPLEPGWFYSGPGGSEVGCQCNTVYYSIHSACAWCQGHTDGQGIQDWPTWSQSCTDPKIGDYPRPIPNATAIPAWAYANLSNGRWDEPAAFALAQQNLPESTATPNPTTIAAGIGSSASETSSQRPLPTSVMANSSEQHKNIWPIIGGAVGGGAGALLLGIGVWLCLRRRRSRHPAPSQRSGADLFDTGICVGHNEHEGEKNRVPYILYNPDDPRTFPSRGTPAKDLKVAVDPLISVPQSYSAFEAARAATTGTVQGGAGYVGKAEITG